MCDEAYSPPSMDDNADVAPNDAEFALLSQYAALKAKEAALLARVDELLGKPVVNQLFTI